MRRSGVVMAWNVFRFCTALRGLGSVMILLVLAVVGVSYYAVVVSNYGPLLFSGGLGDFLIASAVLLLFHGLIERNFPKKTAGWALHWLLLEVAIWHIWKERCSRIFDEEDWRIVRDRIMSDVGVVFIPGRFKEPMGYRLAMLLWSYFSVVITDPGSVPPNWRPAVDEETGEALPLTSSDFGNPILTVQQSEALADQGIPRSRYCRKCNYPKPPRCHHCSVCGRCVLKMDHHCVWVVNCVGALNYKFFLLFLFYTFLETSLVSLSLLPNFIAFFSDGEIPGTPGALATTFLAFVLDLAFALSVMGFLIMHISLVAGNTTTIEAYEKKTSPKWRYDLGRKRNFEQVFGTDKKYWLIPSFSDEDIRRMPALQGLEYPSKPDLDSQEF